MPGVIWFPVKQAIRRDGFAPYANFAYMGRELHPELMADARRAMQTYWASQSPVTDPGPAPAIDALPGDPAALREASSRLVFHFQTGGDFDPAVSPDVVAALGERDGLRVPETVTRFDPNGAPPQQADVTRVLAARGRAL
jgi:hypothetical protein